MNLRGLFPFKPAQAFQESDIVTTQCTTMGRAGNYNEVRSAWPDPKGAFGVEDERCALRVWGEMELVFEKRQLAKAKALGPAGGWQNDGDTCCGGKGGSWRALQRSGQ